MTLQCLTSVYCYGSLNLQVPSVKKCPSFVRFFSSSKLSPSEELPALQVVMVDEVDKNYTAPKWVPILVPGSPWGPFSDFGSPKGLHFFQGPHYLYFRLKNALKVRAATIY